MTVIDASALASYVLREEGSETIRSLLEEGVASIDLAVKEGCSAVLLARRRGLISPEQAQRSLEALLALTDTNVKMHPQRDLLEPAFEIASQNDLAFYDALYLALAMKLDAELLSRDARQIGAAKKTGVKVAP